MNCKLFYIVVIVVLLSGLLAAQEPGYFQIARVKYNGGGDWYNDQSAEINLLDYIARTTTVKVKAEYTFVEIGSPDIYNFPVLFLTGHGNIKFSSSEAENLRSYLEKGGFLYIDDDYGLDASIRREMKKVFNDQGFVELPFSHGIYNKPFKFENGPPKIHEHDNKPPRGFGMFFENRLCVYYTYESNPADGWADKNVHNTPDEKRQEALKFGTNIIIWALSN